MKVETEVKEKVNQVYRKSKEQKKKILLTLGKQKAFLLKLRIMKNGLKKLQKDCLQSLQLNYCSLV